jgi:hypothetical protein
MTKISLRIFEYLILIGIIVLISSFLSIFYYIYAVFPNFRVTFYEIARLSFIDSCTAQKIENATFDFSDCLTKAQFLNFPKENNSVFVFLPFILGILFVIVGYLLEKKSK